MKRARESSFSSVPVTFALPSDLPARPLPLVAPGNGVTLEAEEQLRSSLEKEAARREAVLPIARTVLASADRALHALHNGDYQDAVDALGGEDFANLLTAVENSPDSWYLRTHPAVSDAVERHGTALVLSSFLSSGHLPSRATLATLQDEEYLLALISTCRHLTRYAVGRATVQDLKSVEVCRCLVSNIFQELLAFDFRNGNLRRRYDGVKYSLRQLEDMIYELSLTRPASEDVSMNESGRTESEEAPAGWDPHDEYGFVAMRKTMEVYDQAREDVIKRTRDVQKGAKQAIFSLHRGDFKGAEDKLNTCLTLLMGIHNDHLVENPSLRQGSYAGAVEEFVEGRLFQIWLQEDGQIVAPSHEKFGGLVVKPHEYLGALADFTGEVGRFAVQNAAQRNEVAVRSSLAADLAVQRLWMQLNITGKLSKKEGELNNNASKLERVLYELSLVKATGRNVKVTSGDSGPDSKKDDEDAE